MGTIIPLPKSLLPPPKSLNLHQLIDNFESCEQLRVDTEGKLVAVGDRRGIDGFHMNLVLAVLHVDEGAVLTIEEFGVARATASTAGFFEDVVVFAVTSE